MSERSGLTEETALDAVRLKLVQLPLAAWVVPGFLVTFVVFFSAGVFPAVAPLAVFLFLSLFLAMFAMGAYRPQAALEIGPAEIRVRGWIGTLPRPGEAVLPVVGTELETRHGAQINNVQVWVIVLTHGETKVVLPAIRCTAEELKELRERLEGMRLLAEMVHGEGADEVPPELAALKATARSESESSR